MDSLHAGDFTDFDVVAILRTRAGKHGESLAEISRKTGVSTRRLSQLAKQNGVRYRCQRPTDLQISQAIRAVVELGLSIRQAARHAQMSKTAVHRLVQRIRQKSVDTAGAAQFRRLTWRCPEHGSVTVAPCVACQATNPTARDTQPAARILWA